MTAASARISSGMSRLPGRISCLLFVELVAFLVGHPGDAQADQHGSSDQNQDSTLKRCNHAGTRARRLRITQRAVLSVSKRRNGQRRNQGGPSGGDSCSLVHTAHFFSAKWRVSLPPRAPSIPWGKVGEAAPPSARFPSAPAQCANGRMCSRRMLSDQIIFIISRTKIVAGISERNKLRFSWARCMKYIKPNAALQIARKRSMLTSPAVEKL